MTGLRRDSTNRTEAAFRYAVETRKFEIERFWIRSTFFWAFLIAAFAGFAAFKEDEIPKILVACFGFAASIAWTLQNRGSKYWQESWERKVRRLEASALGLRLFRRIEARQKKGFWGARRFSVSKLAIAISDFTAAIWAILLLSCYIELSVGIKFVEPQPSTSSMIIGAATLVYVALMFRFGSSSPADDSDEE